MNTRLLLVALFAAMGAGAAEAPATAKLAPLPTGWSSMGGAGPEALPGTCEIGLDSQKSLPGRQAYSVRCANSVLPGFGGARNTIQTAQFRGKRVRVSAWLMASGIEGVATPQYAGVKAEAGLWLGVGSPSKGLATDRMQNRGVNGTTEWEYRDFVVDVPPDNRQMMVGYWMQGKGQVWVRDFVIEEVPTTVAVNFLVNDPDRAVGPDLSLYTSAQPRADELFLPPPAKWLAMGTRGFELCDVGVDAKLLKDGQPNLTIGCSVPQSAALRQTFSAAPFWGKRVRFSALLKVENFDPVGPDGAPGGVGLLMANTQVQPQSLRAEAKVGAGWQRSEIVMDVPRNSTWVHVGLTLNGKGQVWAREFKFEEVARETPVTPPPVLRF